MERIDGTIAASVIIPAHDRTGPLRLTLASLARQSWPAADFEVIVVDDGSAVPVAEQIDAGGSVVLLRHDRPLGAHQARNAGAVVARGEILIFLDAECVAHPGLVAEHVRAQARRRAAYCGYAAAREQTPQTWDLLVGRSWVDAGSRLDDLLGHAAVADGLGAVLARPRDSDWAYFWTANASVPADAFAQLGGFSDVFEVKGVEDMELGLRMARHGLPTLFLGEAMALHLPHPRDRHMEVVRDRRNEQRMLERHPEIDVEAVAAFDIGRARAVLPAVEEFVAKLSTASADCRELARLDAVRALIATADGVCLLGHPDGWPDELPAPDRTVFPGPPPAAGCLPLMGIRSPFANGAFGLGVVTDYWRHFPIRTACRMLGEMVRVARRVIVFMDVATEPPVAADPGLAAALDRDDRPYWETTVRLHRELHEFDFEPLVQAGRARAFLVTARDWPTVEMDGALAG